MWCFLMVVIPAWCHIKPVPSWYKLDYHCYSLTGGSYKIVLERQSDDMVMNRLCRMLFISLGWEVSRIKWQRWRTQSLKARCLDCCDSCRNLIGRSANDDVSLATEAGTDWYLCLFCSSSIAMASSTTALVAIWSSTMHLRSVSSKYVRLRSQCQVYTITTYTDQPYDALV